MAEKGDRTNIFILHDIYPDIKSVFSRKLKSIDEIKGDCLVVLDTNALLVPYNIGQESLDQIKQTYKKLVAGGRLFIPGQVSREFVKNRPMKLMDLYGRISKKRDIQSPKSEKYALLETFPEYKAILEAENDIESKIKEYRKSVGKLLDVIKSWSWNDPVSVMYDEVFNNDTIIDIEFDRDEFTKDLEKRITYNIPPGYKDSSKDDKGMGDLLIWHTILSIGSSRNKDIIFVSGEEKSDWWHKSDHNNIYPRYELIDEYKRSTNGKDFHIVSFSKMLDIFGVSKNVVDEVKNEEKHQITVDSKVVEPLSFIGDAHNKAIYSVESISNWILSRYSVYYMSLYKDDHFSNKYDYDIDIIFSRSNNKKSVASVVYIGSSGISVHKFQGLIMKYQNDAKNLVKELFLEYIVFFVLDNEKTALSMASKSMGVELNELSLVIGYIDKFNKFTDVFTRNNASI